MRVNRSLRSVRAPIRRSILAVRAALLLTCIAPAPCQVPLNANPTRVFGHPQLSLVTASPNLVEGRELYSPRGVAVDAAGGFLYVADTLNNRVLAWRNAFSFDNGALADRVIGQPDLFTTVPGGPGAPVPSPSGLRAPTSVAVDAQGNLYVCDAGNNRILRYARPFSQPEGELVLANFVIGQTSLSAPDAHEPNAGGRGDRTLATASGASVAATSMAFDRDGDLWVTDSLNHRVLRYPAQALAPGAPLGPAADLVLGQSNFTNANLPPDTVSKINLREPAALAFDSAGRLFVSDALNRVLVYIPAFGNGQGAERVMGVSTGVQGEPPPPPLNRFTIGARFTNGFGLPAQGLFTIGETLYVVDTPASRVLRFDPYPEWPAEQDLFSPEASAVIGQDFFQQSEAHPNRGRVQPSATGFNQPTAAAFANGEAFVVDTGNHRVLVFDDFTGGPPLSTDGYRAKRVIGQPGFDLGSPNYVEGRETNFPAGVAIDPNPQRQRMYVVDSGNHRILGFADGDAVKPGSRADIVIGQRDAYHALVNYNSNDPAARNDAGFFLPSAAAVDGDGNLWVADRGNSRVLRFPPPFDSGPPEELRANLVIGQADFVSAVADATSRTLSQPAGIAFTAEGDLLVSDAAHNRVLVFSPPFSNGMAASKVIGQPNSTSSAPGSADDELNAPGQIAVDDGGRLYVADANNNRVQVFGRVSSLDTRPRAVLSLGAQAGMSRPQSVAVNRATGEIWVADFGRNRALRYPPFDVLVASGDAPNFAVGAAAPLGLAVNDLGALFVAEAANRVSVFFPRVDVLNGGSFVSKAAAPGLWTALKSDLLDYQFTDSQAVGSTDPALPATLGDLQVLIDGDPAPIYFVSPFQINFVMPYSAPSSGSVELLVMRASTGRVLAAAPVQMSPAAPAFFTTSYGSGSPSQPAQRQIAALNEDNTINSTTHRAKRRSVIQLFGVGAGFVPGASGDSAASGAVATPRMPRVIVGTRLVEPSSGDILYSGLAPGLVNVWQINVRIPEATAPGVAVPVILLLNDIPSRDEQDAFITTIAVE